jgi:hypothetical protein
MDDFHATDEFVAVEDEALVGAPLAVDGRSRVAAGDLIACEKFGSGETSSEKDLE